MKAKTAISALLGILCACALGIVVFQRSQIQKLEEETSGLRERLRAMQEEHDQGLAKAGIKGAEVEQASRDRQELMRLRAEVARAAQNSGKNTEAKASGKPELKIEKTGDANIDSLFESLNRQPLPEEQAVIAKVITKEQDLKAWWEALAAYAQSHAGLTPNSISELISYLPAGFQSSIDISGFTFDKGVELSALGEGKVIYKEPNPLALTDGIVCNVWLFANGRIGLYQ